MTSQKAPRYIGIEGAIGVGKTSLAKILAQKFGARLIQEEVTNNPFLERFYDDRRKYAFQTQLYFLLSRYRQQRELAQGNLFEKGLVSDYVIAKDKIFAYLNLEEDEISLYEMVYKLLVPTVPRPDLVIYLQARPEILLARIRKRGVDASGNAGWNMSGTYPLTT